MTPVCDVVPLTSVFRLQQAFINGENKQAARLSVQLYTYMYVLFGMESNELKLQ